jgi:hypothetical protein
MNPSESYARQTHAAYMGIAAHTGFPGPANPVVRCPDPDEFAPDTLEWTMAVRLQELARDHERWEAGRVALVRAQAALDACDEWLQEVGHPVAVQDSFDWTDDDTDRTVRINQVA